LVCLSASARAEEPQEGQSNKERDFLKELTYRQREYQSQQGYLADKEARIAEELNSDISLQNAEPSAATLQRIDNLKARILEYLQDQIKNNHDYISYLEIRISELLDYKFPTLKAIRKLDESGALTQPAAPASAEDMTPPAPEEPRGSAEDRPQTVNKEESAPEPPRDTPDPDEGAIQQYRHNRVPISTSE
jgi:hypothetical protein